MTSVGSRPGRKPVTGAKGKVAAKGVAGPRGTAKPQKPPKPVPAPRRRHEVKDSHDRYANIDVQG